jgi:hypothetical protein
VSPVARFDRDEQFWLDWELQWLLYGTVYAINTPEPRVIPFDALTVHEGPCQAAEPPEGAVLVTEESLARALHAIAPSVGGDLDVGGVPHRIGLTAAILAALRGEPEPPEREPDPQPYDHGDGTL